MPRLSSKFSSQNLRDNFGEYVVKPSTRSARRRYLRRRLHRSVCLVFPQNSPHRSLWNTTKDRQGWSDNTVCPCFFAEKIFKNTVFSRFRSFFSVIKLWKHCIIRMQARSYASVWRIFFHRGARGCSRAYAGAWLDKGCVNHSKCFIRGFESHLL